MLDGTDTSLVIHLMMNDDEASVTMDFLSRLEKVGSFFVMMKKSVFSLEHTHYPFSLSMLKSGRSINYKLSHASNSH